MKRLALFIGTAAIWPFAAQADIDYNYLQADWVADGEVEVDGPFGTAEDDYDGWSIEGATALSPNVFLSGEYNGLSFDSGGDLDGITAGLGLNGPINTTQGEASLYGMLSYEELDGDGGLDADGYGVTAGARWAPATGIEINPSLAWIDYGDIDGTSTDLDGWRYGLRGIFNVSDRVALNAEWRTHSLEVGSNADLDLENEIRLGARWYWM